MHEAISMESAPLAVADQHLVPITANQRIDTLDMVREFAFLGIFLMNVEYFNRTNSSLGEGMPRGLTGIERHRYCSCSRSTPRKSSSAMVAVAIPLRSDGMVMARLHLLASPAIVPGSGLAGNKGGVSGAHDLFFRFA